MDNPLRFIPSIKSIQDSKEFQEISKDNEIDLEYMTLLAQRIVDDIRETLKKDSSQLDVKSKEELVNIILIKLKEDVDRLVSPSIKKVINATGVVLHTNLGRARLGEEIARNVYEVGSNYGDLEFNLSSGSRGSRGERVEALLKILTGAEAAMVVNNNAAAVFLILRALAKHKEVPVSRGELVEIGGSFRISSIMEESDAHLVEVGTTNKTHLKDYQRAINENTSMILKVHKSNFKIFGFTSEVNRSELVKLAHDHNLIFYEDLGSGALYSYSEHGIGEEPVVKDILKQEVDLVSMSGDKLLGGPQAGIILGKKKYIDQLKKHQLNRTLRPDKMTLAALVEVLKTYLNPGTVETSIPTIRDIIATEQDLLKRAEILSSKLNQIKGITTEIIESEGYVGGGTMPEVKLKGFAVSVVCDKIDTVNLSKLLRMGTPSVVSRVENDHLLLDVRTVHYPEIEAIYQAVHQLLID